MDFIVVVFIMVGLIGGWVFFVEKVIETIQPQSAHSEWEDVSTGPVVPSGSLSTTDPEQQARGQAALVDELAAIMLATYGHECLKKIVNAPNLYLHEHHLLWRQVALRCAAQLPTGPSSDPEDGGPDPDAGPAGKQRPRRAH